MYLIIHCTMCCHGYCGRQQLEICVLMLTLYCMFLWLLYGGQQLEMHILLCSLITSRVEVNILRSINPHFAKVKVHTRTNVTRYINHQPCIIGYCSKAESDQNYRFDWEGIAS